MKVIKDNTIYQEVVSELVAEGKVLLLAMKQYKETKDADEFKAELTKFFKSRNNKYALIDMDCFYSCYHDGELDDDEYDGFDGYILVEGCEVDEELAYESFKEMLEIFKGDPIGKEERHRINTFGSGSLMQYFLPSPIVRREYFEEI